MEAQTNAQKDPRPFTLDRYPDRYNTVDEARMGAAAKQRRGDHRSIQILEGDTVVDLKRF